MRYKVSKYSDNSFATCSPTPHVNGHSHTYKFKHTSAIRTHAGTGHGKHTHTHNNNNNNNKNNNNIKAEHACIRNSTCDAGKPALCFNAVRHHSWPTFCTIGPTSRFRAKSCPNKETHNITSPH